MAQTKIEKVRALIEREACWMGGTGSEWQCDAILSHGLLDRLVSLAACASNEMIDELVALCSAET